MFLETEQKNNNNTAVIYVKECSVFPLGVLWYPVLHLDLQSILSLFLYIVLENVLISSFTFSCPVFLAPVIEETVFFSLYILATFVVD